jgi:DNA-binding NtrC family response regulator
MEDKVKMLVIDDNKDIVDGLYRFFSQKYKVYTASDGIEGLKLFETKEDEFDIVITDLVMPYISGVGVVSIIKKKCPSLPVIAITGWGEHPGALANKAEANVVIDKPFDLSDLDRQVTELLSRN